MSKSLTELAVEIVTAQLAHTQMAKDQVKDSLREVFEVLSNLQSSETHQVSSNGEKQVEEPAPEPAEEMIAETTEQVDPEQTPPPKPTKRAARTKSIPPTQQAPVVAPQDSVLDDKVICLECGAAFKQLTHLHLQRHGLTVTEYKKKHGLSTRQPLIAKTLSEAKRQKAKELGLGEKLQEAKQKRRK